MGEVIKLRVPVDMNVESIDPATKRTVVTTQQLTEVEVNRAKAKGMRNLPPGTFADAQGNENALTPVMIALYCNIPLGTAEEIDIEDTFDIMQAIERTSPQLNLTSGFSGTGEKSSGESPQSTTSPQT